MSFLRQSGAALRLLVAMTVVLGVLYPGAVWVVSRVVADRADGNVVQVDGKPVASRLIGQELTGDAWFHSRPSAVEWNGLGSAPSNLGPSNPDLIDQIEERRAAYVTANGVSAADVPADALTTSASGLDPYISPENARLQGARVAEATGLSAERVRGLVDDATEGRLLGFLGEPKVNVVMLNLAVKHAVDRAD